MSAILIVQTKGCPLLLPAPQKVFSPAGTFVRRRKAMQTNSKQSRPPCWVSLLPGKKALGVRLCGQQNARIHGFRHDANRCWQCTVLTMTSLQSQTTAPVQNWHAGQRRSPWLRALMSVPEFLSAGIYRDGRAHSRVRTPLCVLVPLRTSCLSHPLLLQDSLSSMPRGSGASHFSAFAQRP